MERFIKRMAIFIVMNVSFITADAQDTNRERLFDLFHQANIAKEAKDTLKAISIYNEINSISPSMADKYLEELNDAMEEQPASGPSQDTVPSIPIPIDSLNRRWVSYETAEGGREMWIVDIVPGDSTISVILNENSYISRTDGRFALFTGKLTEAEEKEDSLHYCFSMDIGTLPRAYGEPEAKIVYTYDFLLAFDGYSFKGEMHRRIIERGENERILSDNMSLHELYPAGSDYNGFSYVPISSELKETKPELKEIFSRKMIESASTVLAKNDIGCMYESGIGTSENPRLALGYFEEAAAKNNLFGTLNLARMYREGCGTEKDREKAVALYEKAFSSGYTDAMVLCGDTYMEMSADSLQTKALAYYQKAAIQKSPNAFHRLGCMYKDGTGVEKDLEKAWNYWQRAAAMQQPEALAEVGICYRKGIIAEVDYAKALEFLQKAAGKGNAKAMYELSDMYLRGEGVEPDFETSKTWLHKAMRAEEPPIKGFNSVKSSVKTILDDEQNQ